MVDNQRLIDVCNAIIDKKKAKSLSEIAVNCGYNKQYFTDLKGKNTLFSLKFLSALKNLYPEISENYVLVGEGEMFLNDDFEQKAEEMVTIPKSCLDTITSQQRTIEKQLDIIERLTDELTEQKKVGVGSGIVPKESDAACAIAS